MFIKRFTLFRLFGFAIRVDVSWMVIAVLVTWSLAAHVFPSQVEGLSAPTYWLLGVVTALGFFASILFHEIGHSIVARQCGVPMKGITLFIFGGVAEMGQEPPNPRTEFLVAIAGPIASILLVGMFLGTAALGAALGWPVAVNLMFYYLGWINAILVAFNMVPAFPLDGGRVLRSVLWAWKGSLRWATNIASLLGTGFGLFLIALGIFSVIVAGPAGFLFGMWYVLIGLFLRHASQMAYQQVLLRRALEGEKVERFMNPNPVTVSPGLSLQQMVEDYIYRYHYKMFPVVDGERLLGCVTINRIREVPREQWPTRAVGEVTDCCSERNAISSDTDAMSALSTMQQTQSSRLLVVNDGKLAGVLVLKDLLRFLSLKIELEG
jgi:Zn-dependent protease/CBS domain-containing protein